MTDTNSPESAATAGEERALAEQSDQVPYRYDYGHGRLPFFMKLVWLGFLAFIAYYCTVYLLEALAVELG